jgi:hypothetical protein
MHMGSNERGAYYDKTGKGQRYLSDAVVDAQKNWPTPQTSDPNGAASSDRPAHRKQLRDVEHGLGLPAPANHSTDGSRQESWVDIPLPELPRKDRAWATPTACNAPEAVNWETFNGQYFRKMDGRKHQTDLSLQVKGWATPRTKDAESWMMNQARLADGKPEDTLTGQALNSNKNNGKLNPRWVETLMGLPIGWTMPSCTRPVTIAPMNCDCLGTELSQPPQNEHLELF